MVLGLLALDQDDLPSAREHLLESARTKGSPQLNSFGPNMRLALALLEKGEKDAVLSYLELCGKFWNSPYLKTWGEQIQRGETPEFGANLSY